MSQVLDEYAMKKDYLVQLLETLNEIESYILQLPTSKQPDRINRKLAQKIHSIKGEAGSYGFPRISALCHRFEDQIGINNLVGQELEVHIDKLLSYEDDIRKLVHYYEMSPDESLETEPPKEMQQNQENKEGKHRVLIVENSRNALMAITKGLNEFNVDVSITPDGYVAFGRILSESFDSLITQKHAQQLDGFSLISAIRNTQNINKKIKTILLTSDKDLKRDGFRANPDHIIKKGPLFVKELKELYGNLVTKEPEKKPMDCTSVYSNAGLKRLLLIDDSQLIHDLTGLSFRKTPSVELQMCLNPTDGLDKAESFAPDLILLDYCLGDVMGPEVLQKLKARPETRDIPVIYFTGQEDQDIEMGEDVCGLIRKPFSPKKLPSDVFDLWHQKVKAA